MNTDFEGIERIRTFALFAKPFEPEAYSSVALGKIRRDRARLQAIHQARIKALYEKPHPGTVVTD